MKNVSLLAIGGILGAMTIRGDANASIVSRNFLENALTDYAKTTALDLKADKADVTDLSDKIGTLPEGVTVQGMLEGWTDENGLLANPGLKGIYEGWIGNNGLHTLGLHMLELDYFYIYNPENDSPQQLRGQKGGLLGILSDLLNDSGYSAFDGELAPFWKLTQSAYKTDELSAKIGTLPSGSLLNVWGGLTDRLYKSAQGTDTPVYPTSLEEFVRQIYGIPGPSFGVVPQLVANIDSLKTTATAANETATAAKTVADANTAKIGTLPTEYATVGAALTAIKGIAEEAKAAAVAAIPDPKAEGSSGKYVLTVDIIGDNATYRWEKIDRSESESTTTE